MRRRIPRFGARPSIGDLTISIHSAVDRSPGPQPSASKIDGLGTLDTLGIVAIGRNEGPLLTGCLESLPDQREATVYVDSGSRDDSVERARALGFSVVELDAARPATAARARNAGFAALSARLPNLKYVQFVDGDSELHSDWLPAATRYLVSHPDVAAICGHLRERDPRANAYHRLASIEWDLPPGDTDACGGNAMYRARVFRDHAGFAETMLAGEEPDLCLRIKNAGHRVVHLDLEMAVHEVSMTRFGQWWRRGVRSGHAFAEIVQRRGIQSASLEARRLASIVFWGGGLALSLLAALPTRGWSLLILLSHAALWIRIYRNSSDRGLAHRDAALFASDCLGRKLAGLQGVLQFARHTVRTPLTNR